MKESDKNISVAIFMVTYNHEKYIRQAVEGIVMQKTNFPYKIFIGEDCSTDNTREICLELQQKYPDKIELLLTEKNIGALKNAYRVYDACISYGRYTAICEGDDYWTDKNKLQKQVDFLEVNPEFNICCHRAKVLNEKTRTIKTPKVLKQTVFSQKDVANHNFIQTLTMMFRNSAWKGLSDAYFNSISGDYFINMMLSETGKIKYLPDVMAVYRQNLGGSWQSLGTTKAMESTLAILDHYLTTELSDEVKENLKKNVFRHYIFLYKIYMKNGGFDEAKKMLEKVLSYDFANIWSAELINFIENTDKREKKVGKLVLKPYFTFRNFLAKMYFLVHKFMCKCIM